MEGQEYLWVISSTQVAAWRFKIVSKGFWEELQQHPSHLKQMIEWFAEQLSVKCLDDWCRVSLKQLKRWIPNASGNEFVRMLENAYPQHEWKREMFGGAFVKASQRELLRAFNIFFPLTI